MGKRGIILGWIYGLLLALQAHAAPVWHVRAVGVSGKGQYVAVEEYGFHPATRTYFSRIKLINVWKNVQAAPTVEHVTEARALTDLDAVRATTRERAQPDILRLGINPT